VVYNYSDKPFRSSSTGRAPWFARLDPPQQKLDLAVNEVRAVHYRIRAKSIGRHELTIRASAPAWPMHSADRGIASDGAASSKPSAERSRSRRRRLDAAKGCNRSSAGRPSRFSHRPLVRSSEVWRESFRCLMAVRANFLHYVSKRAGPRLSAANEQSVPKVEATAQQYIILAINGC